MKKLLLLLLLCLPTFMYAQRHERQRKHKLYGEFDVSLGKTYLDRGGAYNLSTSKNYDDMKARSLRLLMGYYLKPELSVGVGVGFYYYSFPDGLNMVPVFLDVKYHPFYNKNFLFDGSLGYNLVTLQDDRSGKWIFDFSFGYQLWRNTSLSLIPSIGYNYCNYEFIYDGKWSQSRHSLFVKVALMF